MTHPLLAAAAALLLAAPTLAGPPVDTSFLKRYAETRGFMLGRPAKPKFTPDGKHVLFLRAAGPTTPRLALHEFEVATGKTRELLSAETLLKGAAENLSPEEKARRERQRVSVGGFADYHLDPSGNRALVMLSGKPYVFDRATAKVRELAVGKGTIVDPKWSPDGKFVSYVRDFDVMAYDLAADKEVAVTAGGTREKTHGLAEFVAQEEMDRFTGYWWSPDSTRIAYTEADHAGVEVWHIADPFRPGAEPQPQFYPRPGKKNVFVRFGIVPVRGGPTKWIMWDRSKYEYLADVSFIRYGQPLVLLQDRKQQVLAICTEGSQNDSGWFRPNLELRDSNWVNLPGSSFKQVGESSFVVPALKDDDQNYQMISPSTRIFGLDRYPLDCDYPLDVIAAIPPGKHDRWRVKVAYHAATPNPTQKQVRVTRALYGFRPIPRSEMETDITSEPGVHTGVFDSNIEGHAVASTTLKSMLRTAIFRKAGEAVGELPSVAEEPPFTPNVTVQKVGDYWTAVVRPRNFDPKKKYPVIVDVYGGPHHLHVQQAMRNWLVPQWLADQGFVVVAIDNRGTPGRGRDWERAVYQKFGTVPLEDQAKGLSALCDKFPELDRDRVGIVGWSFGGYMAANAVLRKPDVFKAAVAGAPVTDWEDYDTHYTERYLGLLPESAAAYREASLLPLAPQLNRPLLLVHGTADDNVYYRHTLKLADALFRAGREFETLPLPGVTHMYTADPQVTERLWERTVTFFRRHLGEPK